MHKKIILGLVIIILMFLQAQIASAQNSSVDGYGGEGGSVQAQLDQASDGSLPVTGLDIVYIILGGILLFVIGLGLRAAINRVGNV